MDLSLTEEQQMLRETLRELLAQHSDPDTVRELEDDPVGFSRTLWEALAGMDMLGLALPERYGGSGQSTLETVILSFELGRALAACPHLVSVVFAGSALLSNGSDAQREALLPRIAKGEAVVTTAWLEPGGDHQPAGVQLHARPEADSFRLTGTKTLVPYAGAATHLLTLVRSGDGEQDLDVLLIDAQSPGIELTQLHTLSAEPRYRVRFDDVLVPASARVGEAGTGWAVWDAALSDGLIAAAAYAMGGAQRAHELAVDYAKERVQFGKPIGSFQAMAHPLADMATEIQGGQVLVYQAAWARSAGKPVATLATMTKLYACDVFRRTTKIGQQVFGGIGFTRVIDMQLYFRRAKELELTLGDPGFLEERIAVAELDEGGFVGVDAGLAEPVAPAAT